MINCALRAMPTRISGDEREYRFHVAPCQVLEVLKAGQIDNGCVFRQTPNRFQAKVDVECNDDAVQREADDDGHGHAQRRGERCAKRGRSTAKLGGHFVAAAGATSVRRNPACVMAPRTVPSRLDSSTKAFTNSAPAGLPFGVATAC